MANYILTIKAVGDLSNIWDYTFEVWSEAQADKYYYMLLESFQEIADGKVAGRKYVEIRADIFGFKIGQHIIFYRELKPNTVEIARVLHNRMDLKSRLKE